MTAMSSQPTERRLAELVHRDVEGGLEHRVLGRETAGVPSGPGRDGPLPHPEDVRSPVRRIHHPWKAE
jgi:hypothetical protein